MEGAHALLAGVALEVLQHHLPNREAPNGLVVGLAAPAWAGRAGGVRRAARRGRRTAAAIAIRLLSHLAVAPLSAVRDRAIHGPHRARCPARQRHREGAQLRSGGAEEAAWLRDDNWNSFGPQNQEQDTSKTIRMRARQGFYLPRAAIFSHSQRIVHCSSGLRSALALGPATCCFANGPATLPHHRPAELRAVNPVLPAPPGSRPAAPHQPRLSSCASCATCQGSAVRRGRWQKGGVRRARRWCLQLPVLAERQHVMDVRLRPSALRWGLLVLLLFQGIVVSVKFGMVPLLQSSWARRRCRMRTPEVRAPHCSVQAEPATGQTNTVPDGSGGVDPAAVAGTAAAQAGAAAASHAGAATATVQPGEAAAGAATAAGGLQAQTGTTAAATDASGQHGGSATIDDEFGCPDGPEAAPGGRPLPRLRIEHVLQSSKPRLPSDVTLVTQLSFERLYMLEGQCDVWNGVVAAAVYIALVGDEAVTVELNSNQDPQLTELSLVKQKLADFHNLTEAKSETPGLWRDM